MTVALLSCLLFVLGFLGLRHRRQAGAWLALAVPAAAFGQGPYIIEDWSCTQAARISNANPAVVTCDTPHNLPARTIADQQWIMRLEGATGDWAKVNKRYKVDIIDANTFSIPVDTTGFGPFTDQHVLLYRSNNNDQDLERTFAGSVTNLFKPLPGAFEIDVQPGFNTTIDALYCRWTHISSFVVSAGQADVTLTRALPNETPSFLTYPGREIHFRYFTEPLLNSEKYRGIQYEDHPHTIGSMNDQRTQVKVPVKVADGEYKAVGATQPQLGVCPQSSFTFIYHPRQQNAYPYPAGRVTNYAKTPIDPQVNRMNLWLRFGKLVPRPRNGGYMSTIGTYAKVPDDPDDRAERYHFYHQISPNFYPGRWMKVTINENPQHHRSATGTAGFPNQPMIAGWPYYSAPPWDGRRGQYLSNLTAFYVDTAFFNADFSGQTVLIGPITMERIENEPDAYVSSITSLWAPERVGDRGPGYEVSFAAPKYSNDLYDIRYSTAGSLKKIGFSKGQDGGQLKGSRDTIVSQIWYSPRLEEQPDLWVGIRPRMAILGISPEGSSPVVITTRAEHLLAEFDQIDIDGIAGGGALNGKNKQIRPRPARFWQLTSGLAGIEVTDKTAIVRFLEPHNLVPGQVIEISGSTNALLGRIPNQRFYTVVSTPSEDTLAIRTPGVPDGIYNTDVGTAELLSVRSFPSLSVEGASTVNLPCPANTGLCTGSGYITASDDFRFFTEVHISQSSGGPPQLQAVRTHGGVESSSARPSTPRQPR